MPDLPWLAPMAGYSDLPFRLLCREYGAEVCETEMVSAKGIAYGNPGTGNLLLNCETDRPLVVQLFGSEAESVCHAANLLVKSGYRYFDFNFGCPARKVLRQGAGAALLGDPKNAARIAGALIRSVKESCPEEYGAIFMVGFKLRLGIEPPRYVAIDLASRLEDAGADWITLHPRYASQGYGGVAQWDEIAKLKERVDIPVLASGDLFTAVDGARLLAQTKANAVMYGRGALRNPFIFSQHRALIADGRATQTSGAILKKMIERHIELARKCGGERSAFIKMRSVIPRYVRFLPGVGELRKALCECEDWSGLNVILDRFLRAGDRNGVSAEEKC